MIKFQICGTDKYTPGIICIPEVHDHGHYLCRDGKVYNWPADKLLMNDIVYFHSESDAQAVLDIYNSQLDSKLDKQILKLKNMVKDLRTRYNPELLVEAYKLVESL